MNKKLKTGLIIAIGAGLAGWGIYSQMPKPNEELAEADQIMTRQSRTKKVLNVNAAIVRPQVLVDEIPIIGSLLPDEEVNLSFETSGKITDINFEEGTHVTKGQLLAKVNDRPLQAQLQRLVAQLKLAEDRVFRQDALLKRDAVSKEAYEQVKTELATLNADIELVRAQIEQTELRAPFDGIIGLRQVSVGTSLNFNLTGSLNKYEAQVYARESSLDPETRSLTIRALYPNPSGIMPGRYASITLRKQEFENALAIPSEAIVPEMGKDKVFLYKNGKAEPVDIVTGIRTEALVQAVAGLSEGDTVIISGTQQLRTGMAVTIDNIH